MSVPTIQSAEFDEMLAPKPPWVLAFFTAPGCGWCARVAPEVEKLVEFLGDNVKVVKVDQAVTPDLVKRFSVRSFPVLILFKRGSIREVAAGGGESTFDWIEGLKELAD